MRLIDRPDGLHADVHPDEYHQRYIDLASKGGLEELDRSPLHFRTWAESTENRTTPALEFGKALHVALLEPDRYSTEFVEAPVFGDLRAVEGRTTKDDAKANKERRTIWLAENDGKATVDGDTSAAIREMVRAVHAHPLASRMVRDGLAELTALWRDPATGVRCRARADYYVEKLGMLLDIKSTEDASPEAFARSVFRYGYNLQTALYGEGLALLGAPVTSFVFVAIEKSPPYGVGVYMLDAKGIELAQRRMQRLLDLHARCLREDDWPCYSTHIEVIATPGWAA